MKDNKDVYLFSSKHVRAEITQTGKLRRKSVEKPREEIKKPMPVLAYWDGMKGLDLQD